MNIDFLDEPTLIQNDSFAILNPGGGWPTKLWSTDGFAAIADRLSAEFAASVKSPDVASKLNASGLDVVTSSTPKEFAAHVQTEVAKWTRVVREAKIKVE